MPRHGSAPAARRGEALTHASHEARPHTGGKVVELRLDLPADTQPLEEIPAVKAGVCLLRHPDAQRPEPHRSCATMGRAGACCGHCLLALVVGRLHNALVRLLLRGAGQLVHAGGERVFLARRCLAGHGHGVDAADGSLGLRPVARPEQRLGPSGTCAGLCRPTGLLFDGDGLLATVLAQCSLGVHRAELEFRLDLRRSLREECEARPNALLRRSQLDEGSGDSASPPTVRGLELGGWSCGGWFPSRQFLRGQRVPHSVKTGLQDKVVRWYNEFPVLDTFLPSELTALAQDYEFELHLCPYREPHMATPDGVRALLCAELAQGDGRTPIAELRRAPGHHEAVPPLRRARSLEIHDRHGGCLGR
mmetsp:Transcript_106289/g.307650  ORF Transcript_106289/g.307650 Transcript_106289/m.307650 type:complete len:363 (+) Transcript_106289:50-1138(+)